VQPAGSVSISLSSMAASSTSSANNDKSTLNGRNEMISIATRLHTTACAN
jgi:hypothetical protein